MLLSHTAQREGELLSFLRGELALSSGLVKRLKWQNAFFLDGAPVHTNARVKPGQEITVRIEEAPEGFLPQALPIDILYEDAYMIALDKPAGQLVHPSPRKNEGTLANALLGYYERTDQPCGIHPVTRLDRDTFGVVLLAKNAHIHAKLCQLMKDGANDCFKFDPRGRAVGVFNADVIQNRIGQKLRLQASLSVQFIDGSLLSRVGHTEADREFSRVFFSVHDFCPSVLPDRAADSPSHLRQCPQ